MQQIEKNTVTSKDQLKEDQYVRIDEHGNGLRILFAGNSITMHGYKPEIGWYGVDYGMAASCKEKDYVHLVMEQVRKSDKEASYCIAQVSKWERNYANGSSVFHEYESAKEFKPDIIIFRFIENCPWKDMDKEVFYRNYLELIDYFNPDGRAKVILTTGFWRHPGDSEIIRVGKEKGYPVIDLGPLGEDEEMKAIGLFEHTGVANHPGDKGMAEIARLIVEEIKKLNWIKRGGDFDRI